MVMVSPSGRPTSERITPGEILSEWPEIDTSVWFGPKFLENHMPVNPQKISRGLAARVPFALFFTPLYFLPRHFMPLAELSPHKKSCFFYFYLSKILLEKNSVK